MLFSGTWRYKGKGRIYKYKFNLWKSTTRKADLWQWFNRYKSKFHQNLSRSYARTQKNERIIQRAISPFLSKSCVSYDQSRRHFLPIVSISHENPSLRPILIEMIRGCLRRLQRFICYLPSLVRAEHAWIFHVLSLMSINFKWFKISSASNANWRSCLFANTRSGVCFNFSYPIKSLSSSTHSLRRSSSDESTTNMRPSVLSK